MTISVLFFGPFFPQKENSLHEIWECSHCAIESIWSRNTYDRQYIETIQPKYFNYQIKWNQHKYLNLMNCIFFIILRVYSIIRTFLPHWIESIDSIDFIILCGCARRVQIDYSPYRLLEKWYFARFPVPFLLNEILLLEKFNEILSRALSQSSNKNIINSPISSVFDVLHRLTPIANQSLQEQTLCDSESTIATTKIAKKSSVFKLLFNKNI